MHATDSEAHTKPVFPSEIITLISPEPSFMDVITWRHLGQRCAKRAPGGILQDSNVRLVINLDPCSVMCSLRSMACLYKETCR
jgi:hypothetical protein